MLPVEKTHSLTGPDALSVTLTIPPSLSWFEGHFDSQPVLPGVAQIEWAIYYAARYLNVNTAFSSLEQVKFLSPILPQDEVTLRLTWDAQLHKLQFRYHAFPSADAEPVLMSSGKIRLCP
ncbi:hypothetical protein [Morganella psychrotolerans]|uniref:ApeI dehydratase-like domain-containing protein n=1 Tax=Morganella psychrotolerans TaxID=368603 RepID=A0A1B8HNP9_9GAMM|nr:hypothetical protein [Morganella psychrotolerans]OBU11099.1 hypothetical protein AYY18_03985 [Morganella psychrotolerans]